MSRHPFNTYDYWYVSVRGQPAIALRGDFGRLRDAGAAPVARAGGAPGCLASVRRSVRYTSGNLPALLSGILRQTVRLTRIPSINEGCSDDT